MLNEIQRIVKRQTEVHNDELNVSLFSGLGSLLQFHYMVYQQNGEDSHISTIREITGQAIRKINNYDFGNITRLYSLTSGLSGIAFMLTELEQKNIIRFDIRAELEEINDYLHEAAMQSLAEKNTDFLHGALGVFYYFLNQPPTKERDQVLSNLFNALIATCRIDEKGLRIHNFISNESFIENRFDMGIAHGLSGFLLILVSCINQGFEVSKARHYLNEGLRYLTGLEKSPQQDELLLSLFPSSVLEPFADNPVENAQNYRARLAWCYGDLNVAWLFIKSSQPMKSSALFQKGIDIALRTMQRKTDMEALLGNSCFCHGSAGLSYFYQRLFDVTNHSAFRRAHQHWFGKLPKDLAAFDNPELNKNITFSMLEGLIGIAAAYLPETRSNDIWNKTFLLN